VRCIPGGGGGGPGGGAGAVLVVVVEREKQPEQTVAPARTNPRAKNFIMQVPHGRSAWLVAHCIAWHCRVRWAFSWKAPARRFFLNGLETVYGLTPVLPWANRANGSQCGGGQMARIAKRYVDLLKAGAADVVRV
jgi:hypothetical protein